MHHEHTVCILDQLPCQAELSTVHYALAPRRIKGRSSEPTSRICTDHHCPSKSHVHAMQSYSPSPSKFQDDVSRVSSLGADVLPECTIPTSEDIANEPEISSHDYFQAQTRLRLDCALLMPCSISQHYCRLNPNCWAKTLICFLFSLCPHRSCRHAPPKLSTVCGNHYYCLVNHPSAGKDSAVFVRVVLIATWLANFSLVLAAASHNFM